MGKYTLQKLVEWTQARIDELSGSSEQIAAIEPNIIELELHESATQILRTAKKQFVYSAGAQYTSPLLVSLRPDAENVMRPYSVIVPLPEDFIRFIRLRYRNWHISIDDLMSVDDKDYKRQTNYYHKGTLRTPLAAIIPLMFSYTPANDNTVIFTQGIEAFPPPEAILSSEFNVTGDNSPAQIAFRTAASSAGYRAVFDSAAVYPQVAMLPECILIRKMQAESVPEILTDALVWFAAGRCLTSLQKPEQAQAAYQNSAIAMQSNKIGLKNEDVQTK